MRDTKRAPSENTSTEVSYIENHWQHLQLHVREAILTLVDGALTAGLVGVGVLNASDVLSGPKVDLLDKKSGT